eukprot:gene64947-88848_t
MKASTKLKIACIMAAIGLVILIQISIGLMNLGSVEESMALVHGDLLPSIGAADAMNASLAQLRAADAGYITAIEPARRADAEKSMQAARAVWATNYDFYLGVIDPEHQDERIAFLAIGETFKKYLADEARLVDLVGKQDQKAAIALFSDEMIDLYDQAKSAVSDM